MREIKFRAWDKERNRMTQTPFNIGGTGRICGVAFFENDLIPVEVIANESKRYVVMQYTGLKDCNEKEIYEGDIVKYWTKAVAHLDGIVWTGRIKYAYGAYRMCRKLNDDSYSENMTFPYSYEVIGNIYENPELLEAKP